MLAVALDPCLAALVNAALVLLSGISLTLLVVLGAGLAWAYFLEPVHDDKRD